MIVIADDTDHGSRVADPGTKRTLPLRPRIRVGWDWGKRMQFPANIKHIIFNNRPTPLFSSCLLFVYICLFFIFYFLFCFCFSVFLFFFGSLVDNLYVAKMRTCHLIQIGQQITGHQSWDFLQHWNLLFALDESQKGKAENSERDRQTAICMGH